MKLRRSITFMLLLLASACSPKNEEVQTEQIEVEEVDTAADSVTNPVLDGTATEQTVEAPKLPLPQPALQLLEKNYPGWGEIVLMEETKKNADGKEQGPKEVRADFNGDNLQDIALQIRHERDVIIVALLQDSAQWQLQELKKDILFNERGTYKSLYYLYLTQPGTKLYDKKARTYITSEHPAVTIAIENTATTYIYRNNSFMSYDVAN